MNRLVEWLLGLDRIRLADNAPMSLRWQFPFEPYVLFGFWLLLVAFVVLIARREQVSRAKRIILGGLRGVLVALLVAVVCKPVLVLQRERVEPSRVALLLDTSQSMARHEHYRDEELAAAVVAGAGLGDPAELPQHSRLDLARRALLHHEAAAARALLDKNEVSVLTFSDTARAWTTIADAGELAELTKALDALTPTGTSTNLPAALEATINRLGGARLAAVVLASDAQTTVPADLAAALDLAKGRQIPVLPIRIGSPDPPQDLAVGPMLAEENVFRHDLVAVRCRISATGLAAPTPIEARLIDEGSGSIVARETVELGGDKSEGEIEFRIKPERTGPAVYRAEAGPLPAEDETGNNADRVELNVLSDKLRVLYVEGYPRFEYRYLKNALLREDTVESSILLLSADADFAQEGTAPIRRFPETSEELNRYDVVIFGDVDPTADWLSPAQAQMLVEFVGDRGGGFGLIAGERYCPLRFRGTPLEKLIPVHIDPEFGGRYEHTLSTPYRPRLTPEGEQARCFRFHRDPQVSRDLFEALPGLYWIARTLGPKPGAETLLEHPTVQTPAGPMPVLVLGRYGAGKVVFAATDDTWRWRRQTGEYLHDVYWVQLARMLMGPTAAGQDRRLRLATDRSVYAYADRIQVRLEVLEAELLASLGEYTTLTLLDAGGAAVAEARADRLDPSSHVFEASLIAPQAGSFVIRCRDIAPRAGDRPASAAIRVAPADLEARRPQADHDLLRRIAAETGGQVVDLDGLSEAFARIRDRSVRIPDDISEPLWDSRLVLILFVLTITTEWILRKAFGLL